MRIHLLLAALLVVSAAGLHPQSSSTSDPPLAELEDYRRLAGHLSDGAFRVTLSVRPVRWRPEGPRGAELPAFAFVEEGQAPRVPGPLLRVAAGTTMHVTLRNALTSRIVVFGLQDHLGGSGYDSVGIAAGAEETVTFRTTAPGTYHYWARLRPPVRHPTAPVPDDFPSGEAGEGPLVGAFIVDRAGETPPPGERVLLMTRWLDASDPRVGLDPDFKVMINGASWPHTERLRYTVGDTVRWRVINAMAVAHPMHLHGFYFNVTARGDGRLDTLYTAAQQRLAVTEVLGIGHSMALTWIPERAGNWLFHCHLVRHMAPVQRIEREHRDRDAHDPGAGTHHSTVDHAEQNMAGLVVGIEVLPRPGPGAALEVDRALGRDRMGPAARRLRLVATSRAGVFGDAPGHAFVLQESQAEPAADSVRFPGSTLVLRRGEETAITVVNRIGAPLAVHWHGMELESWFDGVGGWSGAGRVVRPPIAPGDSFVVRMTPPRAGTFIYHTHDEAGSELSSGLYGALIVEEPDAPRDTARDHVVMIGMLGHGPSAFLAVNGRRDPQPLLLAPGLHRLRFVSIPVDERVVIELLRDSVVQRWRVVARDGAETSAERQGEYPARTMLSAGQTLDVEVELDPAALSAGAYALQFRTHFYPTVARDPELTRLPLSSPAEQASARFPGLREQ